SSTNLTFRIFGTRLIHFGFLLESNSNRMESTRSGFSYVRSRVNPCYLTLMAELVFNQKIRLKYGLSETLKSGLTDYASHGMGFTNLPSYLTITSCKPFRSKFSCLKRRTCNRANGV